MTAAGPRLADGSAPDRWRVLAVVCAALVVVIIDVTVLHVAAPSITEDLRPSAVGLLWIIDIYPLVVAPLLVATGTLGDRLGRRRMLVAGMVVFGVASGLSAFAPTTAALIAARALMGVGGAMIMPSTMSIVRDVFRDRRERVQAVGIWSATLAVGAAVGPLVGGFLVEHFWWGSVFLVNVPVLALVLPFALRILPESRAAEPPPWDLASIVIVAGGVLGLAFGIKHGARHGFGDPLAFLTLATALALLFAFARRQLRLPDPVLDVRLFASSTFSVAVACVVLSMFGLVGLELFFAQYLQLVLGLEPLAAAIRLLPLVAATLVGSLTAARLLHRLGTRAVVGGGLALTTIAMVPLLWLGVDDRYLILWPPLIAMGFGLEIALVAANDAIISAVSADRAGGAAAIEETAYELGGGLGVAVLGSIVSAGYTATLTAVPGVPGGDMSAAQESLGRAVEVAEGLPAAAADPLVALAQTAFVDGLHLAIAVSIALLGASALLAMTLLHSGGGGREEAEPEPAEAEPQGAI
jgi:DHA2 family multidrug resistance protein-like MFS transporter